MPNWTEADLLARQGPSGAQGCVDAGQRVVRASRKPRAHPERDIERACSDLLQYDGWRLLRTDPCSDRRRGKGFGEMGMADCLYIRYDPLTRSFPSDLPKSTAETALCQIIWIEWKAPGGRPSATQLAWHAAERARGALTLIAGQDFPASLDGFLVWYRGSGLMWRKI